MPAQDVQSHRLRRRLALNLVVQKDCKNADIGNDDWFSQILHHLKGEAEFNISEASDYVLLNALIPVLDIAIDSGFGDTGDIPGLTMLSEPPTMFDKSLGSRDQTFNLQIDALASQLRAISSRIRDGGTTHLRRTEAKGAIERLTARLEYSVRTRPKPKKGVFGGVTGEQRSFLDGFLKQMTNQEKKGVIVISIDTVGYQTSDDSAIAITGAEDDR